MLVYQEPKPIIFFPDENNPGSPHWPDPTLTGITETRFLKSISHLLSIFSIFLDCASANLMRSKSMWAQFQYAYTVELS